MEQWARYLAFGFMVAIPVAAVIILQKRPKRHAQRSSDTESGETNTAPSHALDERRAQVSEVVARSLSSCSPRAQSEIVERFLLVDAISHDPPPEAEQAQRLGRITEAIREGHAPDSDDVRIAREVSAEQREQYHDYLLNAVAAFGLQTLDADVLLRQVGSLLQRAEPGLSDYEAKRRTVATLHSALPACTEIFLQPELAMTPVPDAATPPKVDAAYATLAEVQSEYWCDERYAKLCRLEQDDLPAGAMLPLLHLIEVPDQIRRQAGSGGGDLIEDLLARYGERLQPALIQFLCQPRAASFHEGAEHLWLLFEIVAHWTRPMAEPVFRAALSSGWNQCTRSMRPLGEWAATLVQEFADSPYGPPKWPE